MTGRIYSLNDKSDLIPMEEAPYDSEDILQEMLAKHSDLLAGEQIDRDVPRRWLLVMREMSVPDEEGGAGRWSLDHLFLDQDAVPTLVEVKRSSDTRIRREVIGQMLDYAANAVAYWPVEEIRARFETRCEKDDKDAEEVLSLFLGDDQKIDEFWQRVKTNLQAGRIRMVFLADAIPTELLRVVEFLNEQMDPAEVLAIEVRQFVGKGMRTLVPRVLGQTESARKKKRVGKRDCIPETDFMEQVTDRHTEAEIKCIRQLIEWARKQELDAEFRQGKRGSAFVPVLNLSGRSYSPFFVEQNGQACKVVIPMQRMKEYPPFNDATKRDELLKRIQNIAGLKITEASIEGFPMFPVLSLSDDNQRKRFTDAVDWIVAEIRATPKT